MPRFAPQPFAELPFSAKLDFVRRVEDKGLDDALRSHENEISAGEARALEQALTADELKTLIALNAKVTAARQGNLAADDWTCVNVVC